MMKRILLAAVMALWSTLAFAGISCTLPFTLTNGTTADASQVMANYNAIITCLTRAAAAGANTDITSLIGLTTPLPPAQGGTNVYVTGAGVSTGTANAQVIASLTPGGFTLTAGSVVMFIAGPGLTNTSATTWNVNGTGAINVVEHTASGVSSLSGGEIVAGQVTLGYYDGTQYQLLDAAPPTGFVQPCTVIDYFGATSPAGYLIAGGAAQLRSAFPNLFACLTTTVSATTTSGFPNVTLSAPASLFVGWFVGGTNVLCNSTILTVTDTTHVVLSNNAGGNGATTLTFGPAPQGDCSTTFNVPNMNGRVTAMADLGGTVLTTSCSPGASVVGTLCGSQATTLGTGNLPPYTPAGTNSGFSTGTSSVTPGGTVGTSNNSASGSIVTSFTGTPQGGTSTPFSQMQPTALVLKAIKF
jgi:hypothetical protein